MSTKVAPLAAPEPRRASRRRPRHRLVVAPRLGQERRAVGARVRPDRRLERVLALGGALHVGGRLPELTITDVLVLHHICHRARNKKVGDICFVLNVEDTHVVGYSLKKLLAAGLAQGERSARKSSTARRRPARRRSRSTARCARPA